MWTPLLCACLQSPIQFVPSPLETGVWARVERPAAAAASFDLAGAPSPGVRALGGLNEPAALDLEGNLLYVSENGGAQRISAIDVSVAGLESIAAQYSVPVDPVDMLARNGWLYALNQKRNPLYYRPLGAGSWSSLALPNGVTDEWTYGELLEARPGANELVVLHMWENKIDVVELAGPSVVHTLTDLHHLPTHARFTEDGQRLVVLCTGLSAPSCAASGPNLAVFASSNWQKLFEVNLSGQCWNALQLVGGLAYSKHGGSFAPEGVRAFELALGSTLTDSTVATGLRNMASNGRELFLQGASDGRLQRLDLQLVSLEASWQLLANPQIWYPPTENIAAMPPCDGRVFVANRNDGSLSIVDGPAGFAPYGAGCAGSGGFTPALGGSGCPSSGSPIALTLKRGLGGSFGFLVFGGAAAAQPLAGGCTLLVGELAPTVLVLPLSAGGPGAGQANLATSFGPAPLGLVLALQAFVYDPGVSAGFAAANALRLMVQ